MPEIIEVLVDGGEASPGPPLGPALGPLGVNIMNVANDINKKTGPFKGMKVPVKITIADDKSYEIEVGTPPISALIKDELGLGVVHLGFFEHQPEHLLFLHRRGQRPDG